MTGNSRAPHPFCTNCKNQPCAFHNSDESQDFTERISALISKNTTATLPKLIGAMLAEIHVLRFDESIIEHIANIDIQRLHAQIAKFPEQLTPRDHRHLAALFLSIAMAMEAEDYLAQQEENELNEEKQG